LYRPPSNPLVTARFLPRGAGLLSTCVTVPARTKHDIHDDRARLYDGADLLAVHQLGRGRAAVSHEPGDLFDGHPLI